MTRSEDGNLVVDLGWLLAEADEDTLMHIYDSLSCEEAVIRNVADQIISGWTELCSHGLRSVCAEAEPTSAIDYALRQLSKLSGELAKKEIEELEKRVAKLEKAIEEHNGKMRESMGNDHSNAYEIRA